MSVLAIVSKAVFEKEARAGTRALGVGDVWPTSRYASASPSLESLASGGDLYLVTVRPGDVLWFVAVLRAPSLRNFDLSFFKNFDIREGMRAQFRFEALNAFNYVQFSGPNTSVTSTSFGLISGQANAPRQLQFGLKLLW